MSHGSADSPIKRFLARSLPIAQEAVNFPYHVLTIWVFVTKQSTPPADSSTNSVPEIMTILILGRKARKRCNLYPRHSRRFMVECGKIGVAIFANFNRSAQLLPTKTFQPACSSIHS
jgi:hypothetical protein